MATVLKDPVRNLTQIREKVLKGMDRLPPLSPVVAKLLSRLAFSNVSFGELASFVEKDAVLCAHVLRTVNSAGYARSRTITSVPQAMTLLGTNNLRRIAVGATVGNLFSKVKTPPSWSRQRFNLHSGAVGILTEAIADALGIETNGGAFLGGMLHDLGKLLMAVSVPDEYETAAAYGLVSGEPVYESERTTIGVDHAEISGVALTKWGLPELVCRSALFHHTPEAAGAPLLATVIHRADRFVNHLGITVLPPMAIVGEPPPLAIAGHEFDTMAVLHRFQEEWKELSDFLQCA